MNYLTLYNQAKNYPLFRIEDASKWFPRADRRNILNQFNLWTKSGRLERITRGIYMLPDHELTDPLILANFVYGPSYITLESALNSYSIMPDIPFSVTSAALAKTKTFRTKKHGVFFYHHIKPELFFGFRTVKIDTPPFRHYSYRIAAPEKAIFDYLYLRTGKPDNMDGFFDELRLSLPKNFRFGDLAQWEKLVSPRIKTFHTLIDVFIKKYAK